MASSTGAAGAPSLTVVLSQRKRDGDGGTTSYEVVVSRGAGDDEVQHEYCLYHPMAGPVKPHAVTDLHLDGVTVRWEWSENAFDEHLLIHPPDQKPSDSVTVCVSRARLHGGGAGCASGSIFVAAPRAGSDSC